MRAITVKPGQANSVQLEDRPEPEVPDGQALIEAIALGVCGTDIEIISGEYGWAPDGEARLVLGHESLGRVVRAPKGSGLEQGELVVGIVRRPDPVPCPACAGGEWDMCRNGRYTERGIKQVNGYGAERWPLEPEFAVKVDPKLGALGVLLEPASVVAKAWDHTLRIGARSRTWKPRTVLVTGAGPVGLLAALIGRQKDFEVHVLDRVTSGPKPELVAALGATYHADGPELIGKLKPDVILECTGADTLVMAAIVQGGIDSIVCLAGVSSGGRKVDFDVGGFNRSAVLGNDVVFGSVNANKAHYQAAAEALAGADKAWLSRLISRRVPLDRWREAFTRQPDDVKVIIEFDAKAAA
jgi:threonine dehydrogenase-like Zn-dependent dehydrogenase